MTENQKFLLNELLKRMRVLESVLDEIPELEQTLGQNIGAAFSNAVIIIHDLKETINE